ncbi:MAG TPA: Uma2 family endonuclease [Verrucomicrobiae bacterium]|jgi:hypothetical protein
MSEPYEEILAGESLLRRPPGLKHEVVCQRLHELVAGFLASMTTARLLAPRSVVQLAPGTLLRPDLTLVTVATGKAWLVAEVVDNVDHTADTVIKKSIYEDLRMPRLWMVDPRYGNVEVYHGTQYGLSLKEILAHRDWLTEKLIPELKITMGELFGN